MYVYYEGIILFNLILGSIFCILQYDALEGYLSHRETALSHARDELNDVKSKHANCTTTIKFMENQIADKDQLISRLEKQRNRLEKEKEEETSNLSNNKEQNEAKVTSLATQVEEKEVHLVAKYI